jgi:hypothetical protein
MVKMSYQRCLEEIRKLEGKIALREDPSSSAEQAEQRREDEKLVYLKAIREFSEPSFMKKINREFIMSQYAHGLINLNKNPDLRVKAKSEGARLANISGEALKRSVETESNGYFVKVFRFIQQIILFKIF